MFFSSYRFHSYSSSPNFWRAEILRGSYLIWVTLWRVSSWWGGKWGIIWKIPSSLSLWWIQRVCVFFFSKPKRTKTVFQKEDLKNKKCTPFSFVSSTVICLDPFNTYPFPHLPLTRKPPHFFLSEDCFGSLRLREEENTYPLNSSQAERWRNFPDSSSFASSSWWYSS